MKILKFIMLVISGVALLVYFNTNATTKNKTTKMQKVKIDVWSDVVCPFCYLGKNKLEKAIAKLNATDKVVVEWHSFQLDPDFPMNQSVNSLEYLAKKKQIPASQIAGIQEYLTQQGKGYGIDFQFTKSLTFNTLNAHKLLQWSKSLNRGNELKGILVKAYFTDGADLSKNDVLLAIVEKHGFDRSKAAQILNSNEYADAVNADLQQANKLGINGVPYFLINNKQVISGAQDDGIFEKAIAAALTSNNLQTTNAAGASCTPAAECK